MTMRIYLKKSIFSVSRDIHSPPLHARIEPDKMANDCQKVAHYEGRTTFQAHAWQIQNTHGIRNDEEAHKNKGEFRKTVSHSFAKTTLKAKNASPVAWMGSRSGEKYRRYLLQLAEFDHLNLLMAHRSGSSISSSVCSKYDSYTTFQHLAIYLMR